MTRVAILTEDRLKGRISILNINNMGNFTRRKMISQFHIHFVV